MLFQLLCHLNHGGTAAMALRYPTTMAFNQEHKVTMNMSEPRNSHYHGHLTKHTKFQHAMELPKVSKDKCTPKFIKERVETPMCAKRKTAELNNVLAAMRKVATKKD
ncbi:unnamed protein product [Nyctereutes procyonoides]|uniref:Large ribosomal subunit protein eL36 n=1 Tax=Nyctereutes procyonoides TaxID=34880 RepID=A0A811ZRU8_NYCPR|nr:unnamed protein product [Nyctereutes procyonoides]